MTIKVSTDGAEQRSPISLSLKLIFLIRDHQVGAELSQFNRNPRISQQHYQAQSTTPTKIALERKGGRAKRQDCRVPDDREEANYVVSELQKQQLEAAGPWKRFAIIFRMNAQSRLFEEQLRRLQIPYRIIVDAVFSSEEK